jgi:tetratricopeptide (TPR) repeat protein
VNIRTPRRYRSPRRNIIPFRRILLMLLAVVVIVAGVGVYENRATLSPVVDRLAGTAIMSLQSGAQTLVAPTATATRDPRNDIISAQNFWQGGAVTEALRLYLPALPSLPNDVEAHYRVTLGMIIQGDVNGAVLHAGQAVTANPFSSDAWAIQSWALDWAGQSGAAIASGLQAREFDPQNPRALAWLAEAYKSAGQISRAQSTVAQALELDPTSVEALRARGLIIWNGLFDPVTAIGDFRAAYALAETANPAMAALIAVDIAQLEMGSNQNYDEAIRILNDVLEKNPENTTALFWMGSAYFRGKGDPAQAASFLQRCVDFNPQNIGCYYLLGRTQLQTDQIGAGAESLTRAVELGSTFPRHYWWAARAQIDLGNCARAIDFLEPGYQLALQGSDAQLISDFEAIRPLCGLGGVAEPTPIPTEEAADA